MQRIIPFVFLVAFVSCDQSENSKEENLDSGSVMQSEILDTCACNDLDIDSTGNHFLDDKLYTGVCRENYPETEIKYIEKNLLNGRLHGKITYYDKSGEVMLEEIFEEGDQKRSGQVDNITCDCSELQKVETAGNVAPMRYFLDEIPFTGSCEKFYPESGQIYMEVNYKNGLLHGFSTYFNKDGSTMLIEKYDEGELISTIH